MNLRLPSPDTATYGTSAWGNGLVRVGPEDRSVRLERSRVQGLPALITPMWALEVPGLQAESAENLTTAGAPVVVVDFAPNTIDAAGFHDWRAAGWSLQARHTRWLSLPAFNRAQLPKQRRKQLRFAESQGWHIHPIDNLETLAELHNTSRSRKGIANDQEKLQSLLHRLSTEDHLTSWGVQDADGAWIAGCGFLPERGRLVYAFGGAQGHSKASAAAVVWLLVRAMELAAAAGYATFDFGGSMDPGVDRFYKEFGGEKVPKWRAVRVARWAWPWIRLRRPDLLRGSGTFVT